MGDFARNPDAPGGSVQRVDRQSVGLQATLGMFAFRGKYGIENDYLNSKFSNTADIGLDLRLTRWDTLTTAFKLQNLLDTTLSGQTTYQLGFTHKMGSAFDLSLSGMLTTYDQYGRLDPDKTEMKAQAQLGVHF